MDAAPMNLCGLTHSDFNTYILCLRDWAYTLVIEADVLDMNGHEQYTLTPYVIDGQVDVDITREPTRILSLTVLDPNQNLGFDSNSAADGAIFLDRIIRVSYRVYVPALGAHVTCPVFTGPIRAFERSGVEVYLTAYGMEELAQGQLWEPLTLVKGTRKTDAIRTIMGRAGETQYSMPDLTARLPANLSLARTAIPWTVAQSVASGMNMQLYYNGSGGLVLRDYPGKPLFGINSSDTEDGRYSDVTGDIQATIDLTQGSWYNVFEVTGATPKGSKTQIRAVVEAPPTSQLNPSALGHNGVPLRRVSSVSNGSLRTVAEATAYGQRLVDDQVRQIVKVTGDIKPFPFLEEGDLLQINMRDGATQFRLAQFTLPLTAGNAMSIGYQRRVTMNRRKAR
jgi:hypothetical protein